MAMTYKKIAELAGVSRGTVDSQNEWDDGQWQNFANAQVQVFQNSMTAVLTGIDMQLSAKIPSGVKIMSASDWHDFTVAKKIVMGCLGSLAGTIVAGDAHVSGNSKVFNNGKILGKARVQGDAIVDGGIVQGEAKVFGKSIVQGFVKDKGSVSGCSFVNPNSIVKCDARLAGCSKLIDAILDCNAIVYGNNEVEDEIIVDAGLVTACPDKGNGDCCHDNSP